MLTWHDGTIPFNEIWIKVGGDHGGGSFKFSFHICNLPKPNAQANTVCCLVLEAKDSRQNLETALAAITDEIEDLQGNMWRY